MEAAAERTTEAATAHTCKEHGEIAEATFLAKACSLNFPVAKPWGDSQRYDFVLDSEHGLWRVQVKSTARFFHSRYCVGAVSDVAAYSAHDIDFLAAYIVPHDLWYIVPIQAFAGAQCLYFYPHAGRNSRYERYREAWCLFTCARKARGWEDIPVRCRCPTPARPLRRVPVQEVKREGHESCSSRIRKPI